MDIRLERVDAVPDPEAFEALLRDYYAVVAPMVRDLGGPQLDPEAMARDNLRQVAESLPDDGCLILATSGDGALVGCGTLRRIRPDAVEMKRMYVRPEARGQGLGRRLVDLRLDAAHEMGCRAVYADTARGNRSMLAIYEALGFRYVPRYPENGNPEEFAPLLVFLERILE